MAGWQECPLLLLPSSVARETDSTPNAFLIWDRDNGFLWANASS